MKQKIQQVDKVLEWKVELKEYLHEMVKKALEVIIVVFILHESFEAASVAFVNAVWIAAVYNVIKAWRFS